MNDALGDAACAGAMFAASPGSIVASCLDPKKMIDYFGIAGVLLAPLAAAGGLADFFASEFQGIYGLLTSKDQYAIIVGRQAATPGTGISGYVGPGQTVATGTQEPATIIAFNLGTCDGKLMYQAVEWCFPQHNQTFGPSRYEDICTDTYVGLQTSAVAWP